MKLSLILNFAFCFLSLYKISSVNHQWSPNRIKIVVLSMVRELTNENTILGRGDGNRMMESRIRQKGSIATNK